MGHANHSVQRRYRHSLDGQLAADAALLDEYLSAQESGKIIRLDERQREERASISSTVNA
jgi:hypothetical protein